MENKSGKATKTRNKFLLIILLAVLLISAIVAMTFGNADISVADVYGVIGYKIFGINRFAELGQGAIHDVVWLIRFPRIILAIAIGMGLSVSGVSLQAIVKNPLADPYVLGISSGATLGATLAIMLGFGAVLGGNFVGMMAFIGAMIATTLVMFIASIQKGKASSAKLVLAGTAVGSVCLAFSNFALYIANNKNSADTIIRWMFGSLAGADWNNAIVCICIMVVGSIILWSQYRNLNLMLLGDEVSITLGADLRKIRFVYIAITATMVGFSVYAAGIIGFVGLVIPHAVRVIVGTNHKYLIPTTGLVGAIFLIWADVISRIIMRYSELPIGILVSLIGAPCFIYLLLKRTYGFGGE